MVQLESNCIVFGLLIVKVRHKRSKKQRPVYHGQLVKDTRSQMPAGFSWTGFYPRDK